MGALTDRAEGAVVAVRRALGWADHQARRLRDSLTPGQRWTAGLALALALAVLRFGAPTVTRTLVAPATQAAPPAAAAAAAAPDPTSQSGSPLAAPPVRAGAAAVLASEPSLEADRVPDLAPGLGPEPDGLPSVVAFVDVGGDALPGRDDRAMAEAFLAEARFPATIVEYDRESEDLTAPCTAHADADIVIAGSGLPIVLRDCLVGVGARVVSYDERTRLSSGHVSTRRSVARVLVDLARWGNDDGVLDGMVGVAADERLRGQVALALPAMRRAGVEAIVHYVADAAAVSDGVQAFASAGVDTTVFALSVARQREWVTLDRLVNREVGYVVADAADAVVEGAYPPLFDGAVAYTSLIHPWHDETPQQEDCRTRWEDAGGTLAPARELARAFMWCQHVDLVDDVVAAAREGEASWPQALADAELVSPLTTGVGPFDGDRWGPRVDHVLTWRADCGCWTDPAVAADRTP